MLRVRCAVCTWRLASSRWNGGRPDPRPGPVGHRRGAFPKRAAGAAAGAGAARHASARPVPSRDEQRPPKHIVQRAGGRRALRLRLVRAVAVGRRRGNSLVELRTRLRNSDRVGRVEDDTPITIEKNPNDPGVGEQYAIKRRTTTTSTLPPHGTSGRTARRWRCSTPACRPTIPTSRATCGRTPRTRPTVRTTTSNGVIDDRWGGDVIDGKGSDDDVQGHGTHIAGIIGAKGNNKRGSTGLCWSVKIIAVRVLNSDGYGTWSQEIAGWTTRSPPARRS